ncbi:MAG: ParB/RepB/Spo0J family partition protein [Candidatus Rokuibacteriota bacterium]
MARRSGLGRGLGALIPAPEGHVGGLEEISVAAIRPNRYQPREHFDEEALGGLAESIREVGVLQPVLVRPAGDGYELVAGERRWRAARRAGLQTIPALVRHADDAATVQQALIENLHRDDLNPLEEAAAYQQLIEDFGLTHEQVGERVGRSRTYVSNLLRLMQLPPAVQRSVKEGRLSMGHARALLGTPDRAFQEHLAKRTVEQELSVRDVEEAVRDRQQAPAPGQTKKKQTPGTLRPPGLLELERLLGDQLDTKVRISMSGRRGRVAIDFADLEDLERIYRLMTNGRRPKSTGRK